MFRRKKLSRKRHNLKRPAAPKPPEPSPRNVPVSAPIARASAAGAPPTTTSDNAALPKQEQPAASGPEKKIHSITIDGEMTYADFAAKHGTNTERLNELNGLDLANATVLAKGSELYVPAQP